MQIPDLARRRVAVLGGGVEGASVARVVAERVPDARVVLFDQSEARLRDLARELPATVECIRSGERFDALADFDVFVRSPGIPLSRSDLQAAIAGGVVATSATRLWLAERRARFPEQRTLAVTGSKGKSTTASLLAHILSKCGRDVQLVGNIGVSLFDVDAAPEIWVLELSSYQTCDLDVGPEMSVLTSLYPEHLDWHGGAEAYYRDKLRLLEVTDPGPCWVNGGDREVVARTASLSGRRLFAVEEGPHVDAEGWLCEGDRRIASAAGFPLPGRHNHANLLGALCAAREVGVDLAEGLAKVADFPGLAHRLQTIATRGSLQFVDDSISTIPQATQAALAAYPGRPVALIVGGLDRGVPYEGLARELARSSALACVVALGEAGARILALLEAEGCKAPCSAAGDLAEAVRRAAASLPTGGLVLLSPGAATDAEFPDFRARGEAFAAAVAGLVEDA